MEYLADYGLFLAKWITVAIIIVLLVGIIASLLQRERGRASSGYIDVKHVNQRLRDMEKTLKLSVLDRFRLKHQLKQEKKQDKAEEKAKKLALKAEQTDKKSSAEVKADESDTNDKIKASVYVLDFAGDIQANAVENLRQEITAVLSVVNPGDEVLVRLESAGGLVHSYGLAAAQLQRIRNKGVKLTVCVDKIAASGGYLMAAVADHIVAAPFAILGSIGVVAEVPNFHRLLKKHDIDYEMLTAGEYKRTLTIFGENTDKGRNKFQEDLDDTHILFKEFVKSQRPQLDIDKVATGEIWFGQRALAQGLVDELQTSDDVLVARCQNIEVYEVKYIEKKPLAERLGIAAQVATDRLLTRWLTKLTQRQYL